MAALTEQLNSVNSGKQIVNPGPAGPSVLGAIAEFAGSAIPGALKLRQARQAENKNAVGDAFAGRLHDIMRGGGGAEGVPQSFAGPTDQSIGPVGVDAEIEGPPLPPDVASGIADLRRARSAAAQGRVPQARYDLQLEQLVTEFNQKYPDMQQEIRTQMQASGFDHYLYRGAREAEAAYDAEQAASMAALTVPAGIAQSAGLATPNMTLEEQAEAGRGLLKVRAEQAQAAAELEALKARSDIAKNEREGRMTAATTAGTNSIIAEATLTWAPIQERLNIALNAAGNDADRQRILGEAQTGIIGGLEVYRTRGRALLASNPATSAAQYEAFDKQIDSIRDGVNAMYTTSFATNKRALDNLNAELGISADRSLPLYGALVRELGQQEVNALLAGPDGKIALPADVLTSLTNEFNNYNPMDPRGGISLARTVAMLRGQEGFRDLQPEQAAAFIRTNSTVQAAQERAFLAGDKEVVSRWAPTYGNSVEAASELPVVGTNVASFAKAAELIASPTSRRMLEELNRVDPEQGRLVAQASRGAAMKLFLGARDMSNPSDGPFTVWFNPQHQVYQGRLTRAAYDSYVGSLATSYPITESGGFRAQDVVRAVSYEEMARQVPASILQRTSTMNRAMAHLVETSKYDQSVPAGMTGRQLGEVYRTGRVPQREGAGAAVNPDAEFQSMVDGLMGDVQALTGDMASRPVGLPTPPHGELQNTVKTRAEAMGLPWGLVNRVAKAESQWDPNALNGKTGAQGLFQINDDNPRTLDQNINDGLGFLKEAQEGAQRVLGRPGSDWEVYVMHQQGPGGGAALLKPENASRLAVDVLTPLYPSRRIAQQAITGNGGNTSMTAAEFAQSIRRYFESR